MKTHYYQAASFAAFLLSSHLSQAEVSSPHADALRTAGYQVHYENEGGYKIDFGKVLVIDDASIANIAALGDVRHLSGTGEGVDDAVFVKMVNATPSLEYLFINSSKITDEGVKVLAKLPKFQHLGLHHGSKEFTGKGLLALKDNPTFKSIEFGGMSSIDDVSVGYFAQLPHLRSIGIFHVMNTRASLPLLLEKNPLIEEFALNPHFQPSRLTAEDIALLTPWKNLSKLSLNDMVLPYENGLSHLTALKGLKAALPGVEIISTNRAKEEELANWNKRLRAMTDAATEKP